MGCKNHGACEFEEWPGNSIFGKSSVRVSDNKHAFTSSEQTIVIFEALKVHELEVTLFSLSSECLSIQWCIMPEYKLIVLYFY